MPLYSVGRPVEHFLSQFEEGIDGVYIPSASPTLGLTLGALDTYLSPQFAVIPDHRSKMRLVGYLSATGSVVLASP